MLRYLARRLVLLGPVLIGISVLTFSIMQIIPGDPVMIMLQGQTHTPEEVATIRSQWGLDQPAVVQYLNYLRQLAVGDFGRSFMLQRPVLPVLVQYLPATIELAAVSLLIALIIALPLGVISAIEQHTWIDRASAILAILGISMPGFWVGLLLIIVFAVTLGILPVSGRLEYGVGLHEITGFYVLDSLLTGNLPALKDALAHLIMPAAVLGASMAAHTTRLVRSSMLEVARQDFVTCARSKGLGERAVVVGHMLRNALIPTVTIVGMQAGTILGGAIVIETIFAWPGLGRLTVQAIGARDYFLLQGIVLVFAITRVAFNVLTDVLYAVIDPRIRFS
ncbi:MAG: ABC transporter permease [Chloroflexi bacterium]|nr:ABC transporter permease [Chloroflexota bacterium]